MWKSIALFNTVGLKNKGPPKSSNWSRYEYDCQRCTATGTASQLKILSNKDNKFDSFYRLKIKNGETKMWLMRCQIDMTKLLLLSCLSFTGFPFHSFWLTGALLIALILNWRNRSAALVICKSATISLCMMWASQQPYIAGPRGRMLLKKFSLHLHTLN